MKGKEVTLEVPVGKGKRRHNVRLTIRFKHDFETVSQAEIQLLLPLMKEVLLEMQEAGELVVADERRRDAPIIPSEADFEALEVEKLALEVFGDKGKVHAWLSTHNMALGTTPALMLRTAAGRHEVKKVLTAIVNGGTT